MKSFRIVYDADGSRGALFISTLTRAGAVQLFLSTFSHARAVRVSEVM